MKFLILSLLVTLVACDTPTRSRFPSANSIGNPSTVPVPLEPLNPGGTTGSTTPGTNTPGFANCNLTKKYSTADLGSIGICKSSLDETHIRFVSSQTSDSRVCIIPTYKDQTQSSMYLGDPQCVNTVAEKVFEGRLYKTRPGVSQYPITGVMIMREQLLTGYFACMDAYALYINKYCPQNPNYCAQAASYERNRICTLFKQMYPNNYLDIYL